jgi:hypothetical protein
MLRNKAEAAGVDGVRLSMTDALLIASVIESLADDNESATNDGSDE